MQFFEEIMVAFGAFCALCIMITLGLLFALRWPLVVLVVGIAIARAI